MANVYFDLTDEFNRDGAVAVLTSGQAVVHYRLALMSKDGDWLLEETPATTARILHVLDARGARYRPGAPLDVRWLSGGWSSHLEFPDERGRRVRCDFLTRPPRLDAGAVAELLASASHAGRAVIDIERLIRMKRTQRAKDYPVIGELARLLPPDAEILHTTDPDRILELASTTGAGAGRAPVDVARSGGSREDVVVALAREIDAYQRADRDRLAVYARTGRDYLAALLRSGLLDRPAREAHDRIVELAEALLPPDPMRAEGDR